MSGIQLLRAVGELGIGKVVVGLAADVEAGIAHQQQEAGFRIRPVFPGMRNEVADSPGMGDAVIEGVVDILDVQQSHFQSALFMEFGQWPHRVHQAGMADHQVIRALRWRVQVVAADCADQRGFRQRIVLNRIQADGFASRGKAVAIRADGGPRSAQAIAAKQNRFVGAVPSQFDGLRARRCRLERRAAGIDVSGNRIAPFQPIEHDHVHHGLGLVPGQGSLGYAQFQDVALGTQLRKRHLQGLVARHRAQARAAGALRDERGVVGLDRAAEGPGGQEDGVQVQAGGAQIAGVPDDGLLVMTVDANLNDVFVRTRCLLFLVGHMDRGDATEIEVQVCTGPVHGQVRKIHLRGKRRRIGLGEFGPLPQVRLVSWFVQVLIETDHQVFLLKMQGSLKSRGIPAWGLAIFDARVRACTGRQHIGVAHAVRIEPAHRAVQLLADPFDAVALAESLVARIDDANGHRLAPRVHGQLVDGAAGKSGLGSHHVGIGHGIHSGLLDLDMHLAGTGEG